MSAPKTFKVGEAPWEQQGKPQSFKVGEAPWEVQGPSRTEAGVRGGVQGLTLGHADEAEGVARGMWDDAKSFFTGKHTAPPQVAPKYDEHGRLLNPSELGTGTYAQHRDRARDANDAAREAHPWTYGGAELAGAVGTAFIPGVAPTRGASLANISARSAGAGAVAGSGYSEADTVGGVARDTAVGTAIGGVAPAALRGAGHIARGTGQRMKTTAENLAARAMGAERGTFKKLGADRVRGVGRQALDEGVLSPLASTEDKIARTAAAKARGGQMMDDVYTRIDRSGAREFSPLDAAARVDDQLGGFYRSPINRGETAQLENTLESILMRGDRPIPLREAQKLKQELGRVANWKNNVAPSEKERMARQTYGIVSEAIDEAVDRGAQNVGDEGLLNTLKQGRQLFSRATDAEELLTNKFAREQGNKMLGLTDWTFLGGGAAGAAATGGASIPLTVAGLATKKGLERYGAQNMALGLDRTGNVLSRTAPRVAGATATNPAAAQHTVASIAGRGGPQQMTPRQLPMVADTDDQQPSTQVAGTKMSGPPLKGKDKWASDGFDKITETIPEAAEFLNQNREALLADPKAKELFIRASSLKPGSKAWESTMQKLSEILEEQN
jgi:hypothetical protein